MDAVDVIQELDEEDREDVISHIDDVEQAGDIVDLLQYDEDTAGGYMSTEMIVVNENMSMPDCIKAMRQQAEDLDEIYNIYVVDDDNRLKGIFPLKTTITNPSAKYATDAEAVINIITSAHIKKNHFISFGVNAATQPNVSPWLSYTWANEKLSVNLFTNFRYSTSQNDSWSWSRTRQDNPLYAGNLDSLQDVIYERDSSWVEGRSLNGSIGLHIDYEIDSMSDIGVWGNFNLNSSSNSSDRWHSRDVYLPTPSIYQYDMSNDVNTRNFFGMFGGNYTKKFDREGHNLRVFLFGSTNNSSGFTSYSRLYNITDTTSAFDRNTFKYYDNTAHGTDVNIRARYNRPYSKNGEMSYGLSFGTDNSKRDYKPYILDTTYNDGVTVLDATLYDALRRYVFEDHENEVDADVEWTHRWGGFTLQLGMGARLTNDHFSYTETGLQAGDDYTTNHITYNPSVHLSYRTEQMHNFKLNYSLRMRNPSATDLTTYRTYTEDSYSTGNRDLTQSYTHNAEAGWTKFFMWGSLGLEGYGRLSTVEIDNLADVTDAIDPYIGRIIQYSTPYNIGSSWRYGTSLNATYRPRVLQPEALCQCVRLWLLDAVRQAGPGPLRGQQMELQHPPEYVD